MADLRKKFQCDNCKKTFKEKHHLKYHINSCKEKNMQEVKSYICEFCDKAFTLKHHRKQHISVCKNRTFTLFQCKMCDIKLEKKSEIQDHKTQCSHKFFCDFCDYVGYRNHKKRHHMSKHKGLTPKLSAMPQPPKVNKCDNCAKMFFDKSTLNRHIKNVHKPKKGIKIMKHVQFSDKLNITEIPVSKVNHKSLSALRDKIINIFKDCEQFMLIFTNRQQAIKLQELIHYIEVKTKQSFDIFAFQTLISVYPESYSLYLEKNEIYIKVKLFKMKPSLIIKREKVLLANLIESEKYNYIDLVEFPQPKVSKIFKAKDIIKENIIDINNIEKELLNSDDFIDVKENVVSSNLPKHLVEKVKENQRIRNVRDLFFIKTDWQKKKLPVLARKINSIFISEKKSVLKKKILIEKYLCSETQSFASAESDLERLIMASNGWLKTVSLSYIKRIDSYNINDVCKYL